MKRQLLYSSLFAVLLLAGLWGCSEETVPSATGGTEKQNARLTVQVTDGGYVASAGEEPLTRAQEEDYKTTFTTGDKIGLYAVKNNAIITGYNNVCLTLAADGTWTPLIDTELFYEGADAVYYLYYPYQENMTGKVTVTATDANGFFKPLVDGWTPPANQSDYARYTAFDLMTGSGTVSNNPGNMRTLTVGLTHRMAMAVINLTRTKYTLDTDADYVWFIYPDDMEFNGFSPYRADNGSFRYLVKPAQTTLTLSGSYSNATPATTEWYMTANIAAGNYKNYNVDGATYTELMHTLTIGDFYMKDGSLISVDRATLTDREQANCIGIVFRVGVGSQDKVTDYEGKLSVIHGYVLALTQAGRSWGDASQKWTNTSWFEYQGYQYTKMLRAGIDGGYSFPACSYCINYTPAPTGISSGWYFPSLQSVIDFTGNYNNLNSSLNKISGSTAIGGGYYISSSSASDISKCIGRAINNSGTYGLGRGGSYNTRATLTF